MIIFIQVILKNYQIKIIIYFNYLTNFLKKNKNRTFKMRTKRVQEKHDLQES